MKKLEMLEAKLLSKDEMANVQGGLVQYHCTCYGSVGEWIGYYSDQYHADASISKWCASGAGTCD